MLTFAGLCRSHHVVKFVKQAQHFGCFAQTNNVTKPLVRHFRCSPNYGTSIRDRFGKSSRSTQQSYSSHNISLTNPRVLLGIGAAVGLGGLCLYGATSSQVPTTADGMSIIDRSAVWPQYVRKRIQATYGYVAMGVATAASTAFFVMRSPTMHRVFARGGMGLHLGLAISSMALGYACQRITYPPSGQIGLKHLAWALFSLNIGVLITPLCIIGGSVATQAAVYTGAIMCGLSSVAMTAKSDTFLKWSGPLSIGLAVVFISSLGSMFLSPISRVGAGLSAISLYGGLLLFSGFLLYDTQAVVRRAEMLPPPNSMRTFDGHSLNIDPYDPINGSIHIFMDLVNIFVRMVVILSGQRRK